MNDNELKLRLAEFLPQELKQHEGLWLCETNHMPDLEMATKLCWIKTDRTVRETELLEICQRIENRMNPAEFCKFFDTLFNLNEGKDKTISAPWQQRAAAIIKALTPTKGA